MGFLDGEGAKLPVGFVVVRVGANRTGDGDGFRRCAEAASADGDVAGAGDGERCACRCARPTVDELTRWVNSLIDDSRALFAAMTSGVIFLATLTRVNDLQCPNNKPA